MGSALVARPTLARAIALSRRASADHCGEGRTSGRTRSEGVEEASRRPRRRLSGPVECQAYRRTHDAGVGDSIADLTVR